MDHRRVRQRLGGLFGIHYDSELGLGGVKGGEKLPIPAKRLLAPNFRDIKRCIWVIICLSGY